MNSSLPKMALEDLSKSPLYGKWDDAVEWSFKLATNEPDLKKCASVGAMVVGEEGIPDSHRKRVLGASRGSY